MKPCWNQIVISVCVCVCVCVDRLSGVSELADFSSWQSQAAITTCRLGLSLLSYTVVYANGALRVRLRPHFGWCFWKQTDRRREHLLRRMDEMTIDNGFVRRKFEKRDYYMNLNELLKILIKYHWTLFLFLIKLLPTRNYCWFKKTNWILIHL